MKIVCVDDQPLHLLDLKNTVQELLPDAEVTTFRKPAEAQKFVAENGCDVLICEIDMAGGDGIMLAEKMQAANPKLNIIFVTVCDERERAGEVLRFRPSGYLTKPYTQSQLMQELQMLRHPVKPEDSPDTR